MSAFSDVSGFGQQRFGTLNLNIQPIEALNQCWPESARRNRQTCHWFSGVSGLHCDLRSGKSCSEVNEISRNLRMLRTDFWHGKRTFDVSCRRRIRIYWPAKMIASGGGDYDRIHGCWRNARNARSGFARCPLPAADYPHFYRPRNAQKCSPTPVIAANTLANTFCSPSENSRNPLSHSES